jgi:hypothetical protein
MSLLVFSIPKDKIEYLNERLATFKSKVEAYPSGDPKVEMQARISMIEKFIQFLQSSDLKRVEIFEMTNDGTVHGTSANIEISMALDKGGNATWLPDGDLKSKIIEAVYRENLPDSSKVIFYETQFPQFFEWWEKTNEKTEDDDWKGIVRVPENWISS